MDISMGWLLSLIVRFSLWVHKATGGRAAGWVLQEVLCSQDVVEHSKDGLSELRQAGSMKYTAHPEELAWEREYKDEIDNFTWTKT